MGLAIGQVEIVEDINGHISILDYSMGIFTERISDEQLDEK